MKSETTQIETTASSPVLYMTMELSERTCKVLFATRAGGRRERSIPARDLGRLLAEIATAKRRLGLPPNARVVSCYEAGRDGFWLHRALHAHGIENLVVDSASIEVPRRARRRKTDRLDLVKLMALLLRWADGEGQAWSVVRVPSPEAEDVRQLSRAIERLKADRGRHRARIQSLLATQGLKLERIGGAQWAERVGGLRTWDGRPLGRWLQCALIFEGERLAQAEAQLAALKEQRDALVASSEAPVAVTARRLAELGAIAAESSFVFATELFGWRTFANRRELAGAVGLTGTPYNTGDSVRDQGLSKAGNRRMRTMLVEIAWCWLRYQPHSGWRAGGRGASPTVAAAPARWRSWRSPGSFWWRSGAISSTASCRTGRSSRRGPRDDAAVARRFKPRAVLDRVKAKPCGGPCGPALTRSARGAVNDPRSGRKKPRGAGRTKE